MKLELKRNSIVIIPETDQDKSFISDSVGTKNIKTEKVNAVSLGFHSEDDFVLKITGEK